MFIRKMAGSLHLLACAIVGGLVSAGHARPPNFVIVFADDFGFDLECFGSPTTRTVNINRMAAEGMKLTQWNTAHSICSPSRAAILTGRYAIRSGIFGNESTIQPHTGDHRVVHPSCYGHLPLDEVTIAEALKPANYTSMAIGKWHLGYAYENTTLLPVGHGFDYFYGTPVTHCEGPPSYPAVPVFQNHEKVGRIGVDIVREDLVYRYADQATQFISNNANNSFFLYLAMDNTHSPVYSPANFTSLRGPYGAATEALDWVVGQVMDTLTKMNLAQDTLVVFTSDNGAWYTPPPTQAGVVGPFQGTYAPQELGYVDTGKGSSWEGGFRVPAVAWWPGTIAAGTVCENFTSSLDLFVTFLNLAGAPLPTGVALDGKDISGILDPSGIHARLPHMPASKFENSGNYTFFYYRGPVLMAARSGALKAHFITHSGFGHEAPVTHDPPLLFNVEVDPQERLPLEPARYHAFISEITAAVEHHQSTVKPVTPQLDLIDYKAMDCVGLSEKQSGCCMQLAGKCTY
eukprot:scpid49837/ scgid33928/ N-acetylgalactosamine-6-sulfatase; Chondroitinsulfatase; Galactose-6-sulfate sulfatase; N-acetylgalactosamine-6-sulfate sulfatase